MDIQLVDAKKMKTLEEYVTSLVTGFISLKTLETFHVEAIHKGLLDQDESETATTILWELKRLMKLYQGQAHHVFARIPDEINMESVIQKLKEQTLSKARQTIRKKKETKK